MKINKQSKNIVESKLVEAETPVDALDLTVSAGELADDISDSVEDGSAGTVELSDSSADKVAGEAKDVADDLGIEAGVVEVPGVDEILGVENRVTRILDKAFQKAIKNKNRGATKSGFNVLIIGLPGSGKTASIEDWAKSKGINLVSVNAKNNDLEAYINGYSTKRPDNPLKVTQAYSDNLDDLEKDNSVLFLDEYNRQVKPHIRASLYTLINEHKIGGDGPHKQHHFKNMLFTIAAINPAVPTDKGAAELNDAEMSRFWWTLDDMDSDPETTIEFLTKYYGDKLIKKLDPASEDYRQNVEDYLRILDLGIFIVSHPKFEYDTRKDLTALSLPRGGAGSGTTKPNLLCQRSLTQGLHNADGDVEEFRDWVAYGARFLPRDEKNLLEILKEYITPTFESLCKSYGVDIVATAKPETTAAETPIMTKSADLELEDDDDFFPHAHLVGKVRAKNPYEVETAINDALKDW